MFAFTRLVSDNSWRNAIYVNTVLAELFRKSFCEGTDTYKKRSPADLAKIQ
jgi:hypothetical protein